MRCSIEIGGHQLFAVSIVVPQAWSEYDWNFLQEKKMISLAYLASLMEICYGRLSNESWPVDLKAQCHSCEYEHLLWTFAHAEPVATN